MQSQTLPAREWRPNAVWLTIALFFAFVSLGTNLLEIRYSYFDAGLAGSWGMTFTPHGSDMMVQSVEPRSKVAALGLRPGDRLHSDQLFTFRLIPLTGETLRFTRVAPGRATPMQFIAPRAEPAPMAVPNLLDRLLDDTVRILMNLGGMFILWRGSSRRSGFLLGLAFLSMATFPPEWVPLSRHASGTWNLAVFSIYSVQFGVLLPLFAIAFLTEAGACVPRWARVLFWVGVAETSIYNASIWIFALGLSSASFADIAYQFQEPATVALFTLTIALLAIGWRRGRVESRHRFALLLLAVLLLFLSDVLYTIFVGGSHSNPRLLTNASTTLRSLGASLFTYAVLRHKVVDVGFTLNRTLVYGSVSAILLAVFGLAEWALHQMFALEGWEGGALASAGLAVAVFLAFHPVRSVVEHYVAAIFFRPWRNKEQALRKFVQQAAFFTDSERLRAGFTEALEQFSGAACCVYQRVDDDRSYICPAGEMPPVHSDDATTVALRAEADACEIDRGKSDVPGVLAFPMIHCHDLEGFAVLGAKRDGERYRPDEIDLVEWATRHVGQDLYALAIDQLRAEREQRDQEIAVLTGRNGDLQRALANLSLSPKR